MRWILMALLLASWPVAAAEEMWRWVDEDGVIHYSDRPHPGAERVQLESAQSYQAPASPDRDEARPGRNGEENGDGNDNGVTYSELRIVSPESEETLWNIGGELDVQLSISPGLAPGHQLRVYLDGSRVEDVPQGRSQFTLGEVFRGEHTLRAAIVDENGEELVSSDPVVFYVQQASLQNPSPGRAFPGPGN